MLYKNNYMFCKWRRKLTKIKQSICGISHLLGNNILVPYYGWIFTFNVHVIVNIVFKCQTHSMYSIRIRVSASAYILTDLSGTALVLILKQLSHLWSRHLSSSCCLHCTCTIVPKWTTCTFLALYEKRHVHCCIVRPGTVLLEQIFCPNLSISSLSDGHLVVNSKYRHQLFTKIRKHYRSFSIKLLSHILKNMWFFKH